MKKKRIANSIMIAIILVIIVAGILTTGFIQGWFDADNGTYAVLNDIQGVINLERDGVSYPLENKTVLRIDDKITCEPGATAVIYAGDNTFTIGEKASLTITDPNAEHFSTELLSGEMFANCENSSFITFFGKETELSQTTVLISVRSGASSISVLRGKVGNASSGQIINYVAEEESIGSLDIHTLNDFTIAQIQKYNGSSPLCFTSDDLAKLKAERQEALQEIIDDQTQATSEPNDKDNDNTKADPQATSSDAQTQQPPQTDSSTSSASPDKKPTTTKPEASTPPASSGGSCTITIRCDTILKNMGDLTAGKAEFVPSDGVILEPVTIEFKSGETVFDVLKRACDIAGIQLEYSWTPLYSSYYIEGINHLYEFDCGNDSGWMYKVNGWFPNYGCSSYTLKNGDVIVWAYTCQGLGTDVGAPEWTG